MCNWVVFCCHICTQDARRLSANQDLLQRLGRFASQLWSCEGPRKEGDGWSCYRCGQHRWPVLWPAAAQRAPCFHFESGPGQFQGELLILILQEFMYSKTVIRITNSNKSPIHSSWLIAFSWSLPSCSLMTSPPRPTSLLINSWPEWRWLSLINTAKLHGIWRHVTVLQNNNKRSPIIKQVSCFSYLTVWVLCISKVTLCVEKWTADYSMFFTQFTTHHNSGLKKKCLGLLSKIKSAANKNLPRRSRP